MMEDGEHFDYDCDFDCNCDCDKMFYGRIAEAAGAASFVRDGGACSECLAGAGMRGLVDGGSWECRVRELKLGCTVLTLIHAGFQGCGAYTSGMVVQSRL